MSFLKLAYIISLRRILSSWKLELALLVGITAAVALMSSGVVFSDLLADVALRQTLEEASPEDANISVRAFNNLEDPGFIRRQDTVYQDTLDMVSGRVTRRLDEHIQEQVYIVETITFLFQGHPQLELEFEVRPRGRVKYLQGMFDNPPGRAADRVELLRGEPPSSTGVGADGVVQVALDEEGAALLDLDVGDRMEIFPASGNTVKTPSTVEIVGVFKPINPEDEFWYGHRSPFNSTSNDFPMVHMFTSEPAITQTAASVYPGLQFDITWFYFLHRQGLTADEVGELQRTLASLEFDVPANIPNGSIRVTLDDVLDNYEERLLLARVPLFLLVFLVTAILIYFMALITGLIVKSRSNEISLMKSRGSTVLQMGTLAAVEGLLLAAPALVVGLALGVGVSRALGGVFFEVGVSGELPAVTLSTEAILVGLAGALLAVGVFTVASLMAARHGIVEFRQSGARPPTAPFIHRYYVDVLLLALIGLLWWQLETRDTALVRSIGAQGAEIDFTLLVGPVLGLIAFALIVMRFLPMVFSIAARLMEPVAPAWLLQAMRHVSRDPIMPGSMVVLLIMGVALGVVGSSFSSTLEGSQRDRGLYEAGADLRLEYVTSREYRPTLGLAEVVGGADGVVEAAEVKRTSGSPLTTGFNTGNVSLIGVDSARFGEVVWDRPDFTVEGSLRESLRRLESATESLGLDDSGILMPEDAVGLSLWVNRLRPDTRNRLYVRLQDARGTYFDTELGRLDFTGWRNLEAPISPVVLGSSFRNRRAPPQVVPPYKALAIHGSTSGFGSSVGSGTLLLSDFSVTTPRDEQVLDSFETVDGWHALDDYSKPGLYYLEETKAAAREGTEGSARFTWAPGGTGIRGLKTGTSEPPIPALVSSSFLDVAEAEPGDTIGVFGLTTALPIEITGVIEYFPTTDDPEDAPVVVVDLTVLNHYVNLHARNLVGGSDELWVSLRDSSLGVDGLTDLAESSGARIVETHVAEDLVQARLDRPLMNAGWGGMLAIMFMALVLVSATAIMLFCYVNVEERKTEFALLRAIGFNNLQINAVVWFDLLLIIVLGLGMGTLAGTWMGVGLLPILEVAEEGTRIVPPMTLKTNWVSLLILSLVLVGVTALSLVWSFWLNGRVEVQRVLRIGEA